MRGGAQVGRARVVHAGVGPDDRVLPAGDAERVQVGLAGEQRRVVLLVGRCAGACRDDQRASRPRAACRSGRPSASRSIRPCGGSGVCSVDARRARSARLLTQAPWWSRLGRNTGRSGTTASRSAAVGVPPGKAAIAQPPPRIHGSSGWAAAYAAIGGEVVLAGVQPRTGRSGSARARPGRGGRGRRRSRARPARRRGRRPRRPAGRVGRSDLAGDRRRPGRPRPATRAGPTCRWPSKTAPLRKITVACAQSSSFSYQVARDRAARQRIPSLDRANLPRNHLQSGRLDRSRWGHASSDYDHLQQAARDHLWMHFTRHSTYDHADVPIIVRGEGAYIWDAKGKRYLDALAGLFVSQLGHGRTELAEAAAKQARELAFMPLWSYAHPHGDRARRAGRGLRARRPQPGLLHQRRRRGRRDRVEAGQELLQAHRQADEAQGDQPRHRLPRHHPGRAVDHRPAAAQAAVRAAGALDVPGAEHQLLPRPGARPTTSRRSAAGPPTRSRSRSRTRAPTRSPRSSSSRCRTPAAASRRRPATSSGSARSATSTTCCWSPTRSSAPSAGSATCSAPSATATSPT